MGRVVSGYWVFLNRKGRLKLRLILWLGLEVDCFTAAEKS